MLSPLIDLVNNLVNGARVNPLFAAGLMILAVVVIALAIDGLRRPQ